MIGLEEFPIWETVEQQRFHEQLEAIQQDMQRQKLEDEKERGENDD